MQKRIAIGIMGTSGVNYGTGMLELLKNTGYETHLIISDAGRKNIDIEIETKYKADYYYDNKDVGVPLPSGSFLTGGVVVILSTIKMLSGIVNSYADNLFVRAADTILKEKRNLVLGVRETRLHKGHLKLMTMAADIGADILHPFPSFYHRPKTIDDIIDQTIGKIFDYSGGVFFGELESCCVTSISIWKNTLSHRGHYRWSKRLYSS